MACLARSDRGGGRGRTEEAFELSDEQARRLLEQPSRASLVDSGEHMHLTLYVASGEGGDPVLRSRRMRAWP